jgi:signal transduction histidine kinase
MQLANDGRRGEGLSQSQATRETPSENLSESAHFVQLYETDHFLLDRVTQYIAVGLRSGDRAIVIATPEHRVLLENRLQHADIDVLKAHTSGQYLALDAAETLTRITAGGMPDPQGFRDLIGGIVSPNEPRLRIFGEMVALLAGEGRHTEALELERIWNDFRLEHAFSLMCAYPIRSFDGAALSRVFDGMSELHSQILPCENDAELSRDEEGLSAISRLQQRARSLEAEIARREQAEQRMRKLQEITGQLSGYLETDQVLASIAQSAADLLQVPVGAVFLFERRSADSDFLLAAAHGIDEAQAPILRLPRHASLAGHAVDLGQTLVVDDVRQTPGTALPQLLTGETAGSEIAAPITAGEETFGVVKAFSPIVRRFGPDDAPLLSTLAAAAAVALTNARLYHKAQEATRVRDEFLSTAAHDLKTPLAVVKGLSQLVIRRLGRGEGQGVEPQLRELTMIDQAATKMGQQIDDLLDLTRLQLGQRLELRQSLVDLVELAGRLVSEHQQLTDHHTIRVKASLQELVVSADPLRLARVLDNLLSNAVKFSPTGGEIFVSVDLQPEAHNDNGWAIISVKDEGLGIPATDLPFIFDRFQRATNVNQRIGGTGIGLTSARHIVEQHGGKITVVSEEGEGSVFTVRLPVCGFQIDGAETGLAGDTNPSNGRWQG